MSNYALNQEYVEELIDESNRIENIHRPALPREIAAFYNFLDLHIITVGDLKRFVAVYQPGAVLRDQAGLNVYIGNHIPMPGGPAVVERLEEILVGVNDRSVSPWQVHRDYEDLHPFTDGNGRSGRMLYIRQKLERKGLAPMGFLQSFYYDTLANYHRET